MATSSKVQFALATLCEQATEAIDQRIADQEAVVARFEDDQALADQIAEWREKQIERVVDLYNNVEGMSDADLLRWRVDPMPEVDKFERQKALRTLHDLRATKARIEAKANSLVPDEDGNITLTKTQLFDFFDL